MRIFTSPRATALPAVAVLGVALLATPCRATLVLQGSGTSGSHSLAAEADFSVSGSNLVITLLNKSTQTYASPGNQAVPTDVLAGLFFDVTGKPVLSHVSATPTTIVNPSSPVPSNLKVDMTAPPKPKAVGTVGGWQFKESSSALAGLTEHYGLGTAGFGIFDGDAVNKGPGNAFNYGIINSSYAHGLGNPSLDATPLVRNSITFTLSGLPTGFDLSRISNVRFQYGTSLSEPSFLGRPPRIAAVPEPSTIVAALTGLAPVGLIALRHRRARRAASR